MMRVFLIAIVLTGCQKALPPPDTLPASPPGQAWLTDAQVQNAHVVVETVGAQTLSTPMVTSGRVTFDDLKVAHVFSPVTGRVVRMDARPGDRVRQGSPLAVIASPDLGQAATDVDKAHAALVAAERDFERQKSLFEAHAAAQRDYEAAQDAYLVAKSEYGRVRQKMDMLASSSLGQSDATQNYVLRAPIDGEVIARAINPGMEIEGQYSGGNASPPLFTVGSLDSVWVIGDVFEMDVPRVQQGQAVEVTVVAYPDQRFIGTVDWVSAAVDPNSRVTRVRCVIDNAEHLLKPEMFATVMIAGAATQTIAVPQRSVFRLAGHISVFVETGKTAHGLWRFEQRDVTVDEQTHGAYIPVHSGLRLGERVVTQNGILLTELVAGP